MDENSPSGCAAIGLNKMSVKAVQKTNPLCNIKSSPEEGNSKFSSVLLLVSRKSLTGCFFAGSICLYRLGL